MISTERVLVIVAHQDDETIGCGGSLAKWATTGAQAKVVFVTDGGTGIDQRDLYDYNSITSVRMQEARNAADILGVQEIDTLHQACQAVDTNDQELFHSIISNIRQFKPTLVLTHSPQDKHRDHRAISALVVEACWKANENIHSALGEQHRADDVWGIEILDLHDNPDFIVKLSNKDFQAKMDAMDIYTSQEKVVEGITNSIEGMARVRGYAAGCEFGEAFKRLSSVPVLL